MVDKVSIPEAQANNEKPPTIKEDAEFHVLKDVVILEKVPDHAPAWLNQLKPDTTIIKGVLPNGMTYYLHHTDITERVASFYLIQNVGSILENDDQQGLAHFLEHMAFNGSKSFPGKTFLNKMEENGLVFGRDINAYTNFDETTYLINNIPITTELVEDGLQILYDWSNGLLLTDEEIDAERAVIKEEWRTKQSGLTRVIDQSKNVVFGNSKYAERFPMGQMDIVENFEYQTLRDFYNQWYRPDLQAIAIIGDIDVVVMEQAIRAKFSKIPARENPLERFTVAIEDHEKTQYTMAMDNEVEVQEVSLMIRHDNPPAEGTTMELQKNIHDEMMIMILNERFSEISQKSDAPFLFAQVGFNVFTRLHKSFSLRTVLKEDNQQEAFAFCMNELQRALNLGFTEAEIERVKVKLNQRYENRLTRNKNRAHQAVIHLISNNYLYDYPITDLSVEFEIVKRVLEKVKASDLVESLKSLYTKNNRTIIVNGVEGKNNLTELQAIDLMEAAENATEFQAYKKEKVVGSLMEGVDLTPGTIEDKKIHEDAGYTTFTLSNGIKIHYQFVDKEKNKVFIEAISKGGYSMVGDDDYLNAMMLATYTKMSGLGNFSATDLRKSLAGKSVQTKISLGLNHESIYGQSNATDMDYMFQLLNLYFTNPRFDNESLEVLKQNIEAGMNMQKNNPQAIIQDTIGKIVYGINNPRRPGLETDYSEVIDLAVMQKVYTERFSNPGDFTFFVVGDVTKEALEPLIESYIASLPTNEKMESWENKKLSWLSDKIYEEVQLPMKEDKGSVFIKMEKDQTYNIKDSYVMAAIGKILTLRFTEVLREEQGGTYGVRATSSLKNKPNSLASLSINFDCNPTMMTDMLNIVYLEFDALKNGNINDLDLEKVVSSMKKNRLENQDSNPYHMGVMKNHVFHNMLTDEKEYRSILNSITVKDVQALAQDFFNDNRSYKILFSPK